MGLKNNEQEVLELYNKGFGTTFIAKKFKVSYPSVLKFLKRRNVKIRTKQEASTLSCDRRKRNFYNKSFFLKDSWQLAYFAGFCLADGSLQLSKSKRAATLTISINEKDIEILQKFCEWTNLPTNAILNSKNNKKTLKFSDPILSYCLERYGIVPNKTYYPTNNLDIPKQFIKPFLIGFIDGDGTLRYNKIGYRFGIVGNKHTINQILNLIKYIGFNKPIKIEQDPIDKVWKRACTYQKKDICELIALLEPHRYFYLKRKWQNYLDFLSAASI